MDWNIFLQVTLPMVGGFLWLITRMDSKFDKIESKLEGIGNRINRLEERVISLETRMNHLESMLQTVVGVLLGNKTGSPH